jgi:peptidoglycan-associated lipoprotein
MPRHWLGVSSIAAVLLCVACSHEAKPPIAPSGDQMASNTQATPAPTPKNSETQGTIAISDEIRKACGISNEDAYFAFNSARIQGHAHDVLDKVAVCFDTGPLKGKSMRLVGRADPRGEPEYNMVLGGHRASAVKDTLVSFGMSNNRISTTSRGAMDATGTDEAGWAKDRRVDVLLGS